MSKQHTLYFLFISPIASLLWFISPAPAIAQNVHTAPKIIFIIRHAEKPDSGTDPNLSPTGFKRAGALATAFPKNFCVPDFLFATAPSKHSNRPMETITPLAKAIHEKILDPYADADAAALAHELLTAPAYSGKSILICWHHGHIPALAKALGATGVPAAWNPDVFDKVWVLTFADGHVQFHQMPEMALPGDSTN
jgi:hypothetical protein